MVSRRQRCMPHLHQSLLRKRFSMRQVWIWITDIAPKYWVASALDASVVISSRAVGEFMPALHERQASAMFVCGSDTSCGLDVRRG